MSNRGIGMDERSTRIFVGLCLLVLVWIGVYWMWQPSDQGHPPITFGSGPVAEPASGVIDSSPSDLGTISPKGEQPADRPTSKPVVAPPKLIAPEFFEHVVRPNERMQTIAQRYFGSVDEWAVISKANPKVDPQKLTAGMILRIPKDKSNIQGKIVGNDAEPGVITSHTQTQSKVIEYVVQSGDSLSTISQRIYGSSRHARFIFESNRDTLRTIDAISIGQLLRLPPLPEQSTAP